MMTPTEHKQATEALIRWFESQDIRPADASMIMSMVLASSLVGKSKDIDKLGVGIKLFSLMLASDVADLIHDRRSAH